MNLADTLEYYKKRLGNLVVVSGPSGVGKDTLLRRLEQVCPGICRCVTFTTREPRAGEICGQDYYFISQQEFDCMIRAGEFLEYAKVHLHMYGSPLAPVVRARQKGMDVILKIDVQGGLAAKQKVPDAVLVFVAPPSLEELERRLRARYTDSETAIAKRLQDARKELQEIEKYDYLVVNDNIETAVDEIRSIIIAERRRIISPNHGSSI